MNHFRLAMLSLAAAGLAASVAPAHAYRMIQGSGRVNATVAVPVVCENPTGFAHPYLASNEVQWYINPSGQDSSKVDALRNAIGAWNLETWPDYQLVYAGQNSGTAVKDGFNTMLFSAGGTCVGRHCFALTLLYLDADQAIKESDITFNSRYFGGPGSVANLDLEAAAAHELGHTLGLHHTNVRSYPYPTMLVGNQGPPGRTPEIDDKDGVGCSKNRYTWLTVSKFGTGSGTVMSTSSPGINCGTDCSKAYKRGTSVTLEAVPAAGSVFGGWSGACSGTGPCTVSLTQARLVTATFSASSLRYLLTVTKDGGTYTKVTSSPAGITCDTDCSENYPVNTSVTLEAYSWNGWWVFVGWSGGCTGTEPTCSVKMSQARSVKANFMFCKLGCEGLSPVVETVELRKGSGR